MRRGGDLLDKKGQNWRSGESLGGGLRRGTLLGPYLARKPGEQGRHGMKANTILKRTNEGKEKDLPLYNKYGKLGLQGSQLCGLETVEEMCRPLVKKKFCGEWGWQEKCLRTGKIELSQERTRRLKELQRGSERKRFEEKEGGSVDPVGQGRTMVRWWTGKRN